MGSYRAVVQYHFKKGMEEQGIRYLENELFKKAHSLGCHHIELLQDEKDHSFFIAVAEWNHFDEAKKFQSHFEKIEKELMRFCSKTPTRHFCKVHFEHVEKSKKVA
jgi:hypothetical protein